MAINATMVIKIAQLYLNEQEQNHPQRDKHAILISMLRCYFELKELSEKERLGLIEEANGFGLLDDKKIMILSTFFLFSK